MGETVTQKQIGYSWKISITKKIVTEAKYPDTVEAQLSGNTDTSAEACEQLLLARNCINKLLKN